MRVIRNYNLCCDIDLLIVRLKWRWQKISCLIQLILLGRFIIICLKQIIIIGVNIL
jgi:hypothetical protein